MKHKIQTDNKWSLLAQVALSFGSVASSLVDRFKKDESLRERLATLEEKMRNVEKNQAS